MRPPSRRTFLQSASLSLAWASAHPLLRGSSLSELSEKHFLEEFGYADVTLASDIHENQLKNTHSVLMGLDEDRMLKPLRQMAGQPAPGEELGGWYLYDPEFDFRKTDTGFQEQQIDVKKLLRGKIRDIAVHDQDILFVPTSGIKSAMNASALVATATTVAIYRVPF